ncbi:hypothetical protein QQZ08_005692 [Neonectria magnoliae]|uniref:Uncharacterized protein n=1 Tax=Neonectria magnoliae TaxID=2732573 RepID=A0ABR1I3D0_9HYPO
MLPTTYLTKTANFEFQNVILMEEKQSQLFQLFTPPNLPLDPKIIKLQEQRAELKQGNCQIDGYTDKEEIWQLTRETSKKLTQRYKKVAKQYREHYFYNHPT